MPARCVVTLCAKTHKDGVSLFKFPKDPELHLKWVKQVRRTFKKYWTPTHSSLLCSGHFELDCFDSGPAIKESLGFSVQHKCVLLPGAVPTVFHSDVRPRPRWRAIAIASASASGLKNADSAERQHKCSTYTSVRSCVQKRQKIQMSQHCSVPGCTSTYSSEKRDELLIQKVSQHPWLYDDHHKKHRSIKGNSWREIAAEMNMKVDVCKDRWRYLKKQYMKKRSLGTDPLSTTGSGNDSSPAVKWVFPLLDALLRNVEQHHSKGISSRHEASLENSEPVNSSTSPITLPSPRIILPSPQPFDNPSLMIAKDPVRRQEGVVATEQDNYTPSPSRVCSNLVMEEDLDPSPSRVCFNLVMEEDLNGISLSPVGLQSPAVPSICEVFPNILKKKENQSEHFKDCIPSELTTHEAVRCMYQENVTEKYEDVSCSDVRALKRKLEDIRNEAVKCIEMIKVLQQNLSSYS